MKNRYLLGVLTSTVFLASIMGGQVLTGETVLADTSILDPLNPQTEIEPIDRLSTPPETLTETSTVASQPESTTQTEWPVEPEPEVKLGETSATAESTWEVDRLAISPVEDSQKIANQWEKLGLNQPKLLPIAQRRGYQKKFVTDNFFKQDLTIPPDFSGDNKEMSSELSRICYVMSGKLLFGRQGRSLY